jgi:hypothetical protein
MTKPKKLTLLGLAAAATTLLFHIPVTRAIAQGNSSNRQLRLRAYFLKYAGPVTPDFGDQFTLTGNVAPFDTPNQVIGTIAIHFVATAPFAAETMLNGVMNLPEGQISFAGLSPTQEPRIPGPITGGTGSYWNARGQVAHLSFAGGVEELILTFNGNTN